MNKINNESCLKFVMHSNFIQNLIIFREFILTLKLKRQITLCFAEGKRTHFTINKLSGTTYINIWKFSLPKWNFTQNTLHHSQMFTVIVCLK